MSYKNWYRDFLRLIIIPLLISGFLLHFTLLPTGHAQVTTAITPDGTMGTTVTINGNVYDIDGGSQHGTNLFQSFGLFSVGEGDIASFNGPAEIANILSRVTGGVRSDIYGTLRSTIDGANLYLFNPSGVVFGPEASLDVTGSFHVSTADYLKLGDGVRFNTIPGPQDALLTTAPVSAFGFLGENPVAPISIEGSTLEVPEGKTISVIGGDINIIEGGALNAPSGRINIASVASAGEVIPNSTGDSPDLQADSFNHLGKVTLNASPFLSFDVNQDVTVYVAHDDRIDTKPYWLSFFTDTGENIRINNRRLSIYKRDYPAGTVTLGRNEGGRRMYTIMIVGRDQANTEVSNLAVSSGLTYEVVENGLENGSRAYIDRGYTYASVPGWMEGATYIKTAHNDRESSNRHAYVNTSGNPGGTAIIRGGRLMVEDSYVWSDTEGAANGSEIGIDIDVSEDLIITDGSSITTDVISGAGDAGDIKIDAGNLTMTGNNRIGSLAYEDSSGDSGNVTVTITGNLEMNSGGEITTSTKGSGDAGYLEVEADSIRMTGKEDSDLLTGIFSNTFNSGKGGIVNLKTRSLEITNHSSLQAGTFGSGEAGGLNVTADSIFISGVSDSRKPFTKDFTGMFTTTTEDGIGGDINLKTDNILVTDKGEIASITKDSGPAGNIYINPYNGSLSVNVTDGGVIIASTYASGSGGDIEINASNVTVSGSGQFFDLDNSNGRTGIASQVGSTGSAGGIGYGGDIRITAESLRVLDGATITTDTLGTGNAGNIDVKADNVLVSGLNRYLQENFINSGANDKLAYSNISASSRQSGTSSGAVGKAGNIKIEADDSLAIRNNGIITSSTETNSDGADISLIGNNVTLENNALVTAKSSGEGDAGKITINAGNTYLSENSSVTTEAKEASGGNIQLTAGYLTHLVDSEISSSVGGGSDTKGGNITMSQQYGVLDNSKIIAQANEGSGGNIQITAGVFLADPNSIVSASSASGIDGQVDINAPVTNISGSISQLQKNYSSAASLLLKPCAVRMSGGQQSSLVAYGRDGLPVQPGDLLPSPLYVAAMVEDDAKVAGLWDKPALSYGMNAFEEKGLLPLAMLDDDSGCSSCPE